MSSLVSAALTKASIEAHRYGLRLRQPAATDEADLARKLATAENFLFVCHGNICRSPLAERYMAASLDGDLTNDLSVASAGVETRAGRQSPETAISVAAEYGVDLDDHRSQPLTPELIEWSDVLFIKDVSNYRLLRRNYDEWEEKTYFLGTVTDGGSFEILDPYGRDRDGFRYLYGEVVKAVDDLNALLVEQRE